MSCRLFFLFLFRIVHTCKSGEKNICLHRHKRDWYEMYRGKSFGLPARFHSSALIHYWCWNAMEFDLRIARCSKNCKAPTKSTPPLSAHKNFCRSDFCTKFPFFCLLNKWCRSPNCLSASAKTLNIKITKNFLFPSGCMQLLPDGIALQNIFFLLISE